MFCSTCPSQSTVARVIYRNGAPCLLASFSGSTPPLIWQFDLEKMSNYTVMLREKEGEWDLGIALPQGTFTVVAHFDERGDAEAAYAAVRRALLSGEPTCHHGLRWVFALILLALAAFLLFPSGAGKEMSDVPSAPPAKVGEIQPEEPPTIQPGVPVRADDVLQPPAD